MFDSLPASRSTLTPFFAPAGVAVIGASANPQKLSYGILRNLVSFGFQGAVYPVNPGRSEILGLRCYPTITAAPDPLDLAVIVVPAPVCPAALHECGVRGVKAAIVISGGFRETGPAGLKLEMELLEIARAHDMRLIGPNCVGTLDAYTGLDTTFIRTMPEPGDIAFISQSGAICGGILEWTAGKGVGFSRFATLGNAADVTETDLMEALADDPRTKVIVAYLEAIQDGPRFIDVARRVTPRKPVLVIKAGVTEAGTRAVSSHTGSLAGAMAAYDAAFHQSGVIRVDTVEDLFNQALALAWAAPSAQRPNGSLPRGNRVAIVTNAGGPASLAADALEEAGLTMPPPSAQTRAFLAAHTCSEAQLGNPFDLLGGADAGDYELAIRALLADPTYDAVLAILVPQALVDPVAVAEAIGRAAADAPHKPVVTCFMGDEAVRQPRIALHQHRIALYQFPKQAARALGVMWRYASQKPAISSCEPTAKGDPARVNLPAHQTHLGEMEARPVLDAYGIPQPRAKLARSVDEAAQLATAQGFPAALKIVSPDIFHKSEVGGIALRLNTAQEVRAAYTEMMERVRQRQPEARIAGALVAQMAPPGHELIVGMRRDPQFGPLLMFGLGGIYVELLRDVAFRIAPFDRAEALAMIAETHAGRLLRGLRGQPPSDIDAAADVILRVAQLALDCPRIQEIDINPLIAYPAGQGVLAVDVRMVTV